MIHGEQRESESDMNDGRYSPPAPPDLSLRTMEVGVGVPVHPAKEKPPINVVGDVGGRIAIMVVRLEIPSKWHYKFFRRSETEIKVAFSFFQDDLIDDVQSFVAAAEVLKERGAYKIYVLATHGLLSSDAPRLLEESPIDEVNFKINFRPFRF